MEFVLQDERQEFGMGEPAGGGFLQPHVQRGGQTGEPELFQGQGKLRVVHEGNGMR